MNFDADLRRALAPLAGDPRQDAARVLAALPAARPAPWKPLLWAALGAAAGVAATLLPWRATPVHAPGDVARAQRPAPTLRVRAAHGEVFRGDGAPLADDAALAWGEPLTTRYGAAEIAPDPGAAVLLRVGPDALVVAHGPREFECEAGRLWIDASPADDDCQVWLGAHGRVALADGALDAILEKGALSVAVVRGKAIYVDEHGGVHQLAAMQCFARPPDGEARIEAIEPLARTEWMAPFLASAGNAAERGRRLEDLVRRLADPAARARADRQVRMLGASVCRGLLLAMDLASDPDHQRALALLIADLADYADRSILLPMLRSDDADVRAAMYRGLRRLTGSAPPSADSEVFWRNAPALLRMQAAEEWWLTLHK